MLQISELVNSYCVLQINDYTAIIKEFNIVRTSFLDYFMLNGNILLRGIDIFSSYAFSSYLTTDNEFSKALWMFEDFIQYIIIQYPNANIGIDHPNCSSEGYEIFIKCLSGRHIRKSATNKNNYSLLINNPNKRPEFKDIHEFTENKMKSELNIITAKIYNKTTHKLILDL